MEPRENATKASQEVHMPSDTQQRELVLRRGVIRWTLRFTFALMINALLLFPPAGRWDWWNGWLFLLLQAGNIVAQLIVLLPRNPELFIERTRVQRGTKGWDAVIASFAAALLPMASWVVAGLDTRHGWSSAIPASLQILGVVLYALGWAIALWAMASNPFFSLTVRIQDERSHTVASGGPYCYIRHPGYIGGLLLQLAQPLILASWWAFIPMALAALLYIIRTMLEDRTLLEELPGYAEYARETPHRLLPGVW